MRRHIPLLLLALVIASCDEDPIQTVVVGEPGESDFDVILTDDPANDPGTSDGDAPLPVVAEFAGDIRVALRTQAGAMVTVGLARDLLFDLQQAADSLALPAQSRPADGTYTGAQISFEGVTVRLREGSIVGDSTLTQDVVLDLATIGPVTVDLITQPIVLSEQTDPRVVLDLNAERWITTTNLGTRSVPQSEVRNNLSIDVL